MSSSWLGRLAVSAVVCLGAVGSTSAAEPPRDSSIAGRWTYYNNMAWHAYYRGDYELARFRFAKAIETVRPHQEEHSRLLSRSCHDLTRILCLMDRHSDAEEMATWVVKVREADDRTRDDVMFDSLYLLALIHQVQGRDAEAIPLLRKAVAIEQRNLPATDVRLAITFKELADLEVRAGELQAAEADYRKAVTIYKRAPKPSLDLADAVHAHAEALQKLGRTADAEAATAEAERIRKEAARTPRVASLLESPLAASTVKPAAH